MLRELPGHVSTILGVRPMPESAVLQRSLSSRSLERAQAELLRGDPLDLLRAWVSIYRKLGGFEPAGALGRNGDGYGADFAVREHDSK